MSPRGTRKGRTMPRKNMVGICLGEVVDPAEALTETREAGFDYFCANVVTDEYRKSALDGRENDAETPFGWFDMLLQTNDWCQSTVGILSDLHLKTESPNKLIRERACKLISKELGYSQHLAMYSTILNLPQGDSTNLCRLINSKISNDGVGHSNMSIWARFPMTYDGREAAGSNLNGGDVMVNGEQNSNLEDSQGISSWSTWNRLRCAVAAERRVQPVLILPVDLPDDDEIDRWLGEPVRAICLEEENFITNQRNFPVLPKRTQRIIKNFMDIGAHMIINCKNGKKASDYAHHKQYLEFQYQQRVTEWEGDPVLKFTKGYEDYLQSPLQPLMDNLEANTYEVFERDPTKYQLYQEAITKALLAKVPEEEKDDKVVVAMVVGAGRGPIVRNCLNAAENANRKVRVYAVEKNVNAVCTLLHLKHHVWGDKVTVVSGDMREWKAVEKADILISELLGSFGDNELSPECLDGAQKFLKEDGIMIPKNYTSFIGPIMTPKLHADVKSFADPNKHQWSHFETPYVVYMKNFYAIDKPKALFSFAHPKTDSSSNDRYETLEFVARQDCLMHGLAGYFESELFDNVLMSIHPPTHSEGMFSWFPIYFPIREPIPVKQGDKIKVNFWRCSNKHTVWYEWSVSQPDPPNAIHNVNGRSYTIGL